MKYELTQNKQYNSIEIKFDAKPTAEIIKGLKALKYRWHSAKQLWYGYSTADEVLAVLEGKQAETKAVDTYAQEQEENRKLYKALIDAQEKDATWTEWLLKHAAAIVKLDCNILYVFDRPEIKTDFCFGYGYCGVTTSEEMQAASNMAQKARTSEEYFLDKNLEKVIFDWHALADRWPLFAKNTYIYGTNEMGVTHSVIYSHYANGTPDEKALTENDIKKLQEAQEHVKIDFEKRLKTYLKRYGTSKVRSWSYLSD